jgi:predicted AAA+ superfamily ATPase
MFILTGSNNFLLQQNISQTLAGRIGYINLLPFSINELQQAKLLIKSDDDLMLKGFYPPIYHQKILPQDWIPNYIKTYIERDVRQIKNITDLLQFEKFVRLLAGRHGQELNSSSLSIDAGVDVKTIQSWLGILESSFIVYLLKPHFKNFNKTIVKRPKIYFYDSALVCWLLEITKAAQLQIHPQRGAIFEGMVITEMVKKRTNAGLPVNVYYWRDKTGNEIDIIVDDAGKLLPVEIKSGKTLHSEFTKSLHYYMGISKVKNACLLYGGDLLQKRSSGILTQNWKNYFL